MEHWTSSSAHYKVGLLGDLLRRAKKRAVSACFNAWRGIHGAGTYWAAGEGGTQRSLGVLWGILVADMNAITAPVAGGTLASVSNCPAPTAASALQVSRLRCRQPGPPGAGRWVE